MPEYSIESGLFHINRGMPVLFEQPPLRLPLVTGMLIGRVAGSEEQKFCSGNRPNYDGEKLIIPQNAHSSTISRRHGRITGRGTETSMDFSYEHLSRSGMQTCLWTPEDGLVAVVSQCGEAMELCLSGECAAERYLFLGGKSDMDDLAGKFRGFSYYARIRRGDSGLLKKFK